MKLQTRIRGPILVPGLGLRCGPGLGSGKDGQIQVQIQEIAQIQFQSLSQVGTGLT